jgi:hypothetical protein
MVLPHGISNADVSVDPLSINTLPQAATTEGAAASARDQQKRHAYARVEPNGYGFVPSSVDSDGRLGLPAIKLLQELGDEAPGPGGVSHTSFVAGALRKIMGFMRGNSVVIGHLPACWLGPAAPASCLAWACPLMLVWSSCGGCFGLLPRSLTLWCLCCHLAFDGSVVALNALGLSVCFVIMYVSVFMYVLIAEHTRYCWESNAAMETTSVPQGSR